MTILVVGFLVFFSGEIVLASFGSNFGGRILNTTATEIQEKEWSGYTCTPFGTTITIRPIGSPPRTPTSYIIPTNTRSRTGTTIRSGQLILGKYGGETAVNCTLNAYPFTITSVYLNTINLFGTSR